MLLILRAVLATLFCILVCIFGSVYCLFSPRNPRHVATFGHLFSRLSTLFGIKVETRVPADAANNGNCIYIANHQNNYDMVTAANIVQPRTVTVGKKSLVWIPFFGPLYWLTGNLLIDRDNRAKAHGTIAQVAEQFKKKDISIWMFPEGTRSRGRGLMPFKTGAFHAAIAAGVPIVPICVSTTSGNINLNRWNNGHVIVEMLAPVDTSKYGKENVRELAAHCRELMEAKIAQLDAEVAQRNAAKK
ncbi:1-acylglycerol-3-phosphate O-acyltransferase [Serratia marcescens]|uniref:1-acylglycerol-3-phosphate O-acyltransferase n=1 Tax=Serratia marcescens TaxID=615 RepID=UPI0013778580|nr:1-acylglycerol-3-phosphate O-acyltransferase [Serratia marcescens]MBH3209829.1 1-acylglycerol-3-phosphate O-acyltransferase [Serratia marcescens]NCI55755.1 1-acylglycerol-3-phosphate O-acyltransferase [Serratia marcescens]NDJ07180.1 1-acylglycerol-3-phosphate O-acyltransferase [Serratia marcescens]NDJ30574.1 1-acylglycerol-3-phosphate O-acyltransferase [Serratia marcescens]NDJ44553.1 1-acylglycerol-3-phosphate O-acyltransferase [Serratia marcescens]